MKTPRLFLMAAALSFALSVVFVGGCSSDKEANRAKMTGAKYWVDKAYPGKAYDVQVTEAVQVEDGKFRVKAIVDGETRVGIYDPKTETFDEGFYSLAHEKTKKVAELEEENRYLKDRADKLEKEMYQMKLRMKYMRKGKGDPEDEDEITTGAKGTAKSEDKKTSETAGE